MWIVFAACLKARRVQPLVVGSSATTDMGFMDGIKSTVYSFELCLFSQKNGYSERVFEYIRISYLCCFG